MMNIDLSYKECCILKHSLKKTMQNREKVIATGIDTGRNEEIELSEDIDCYRKIKAVLDEFYK